MKKVCIVCHIEKDDNEKFFNEEHIFLYSIGGRYSTFKVCIDCNSTLNEKIDQPFLKHQRIAYLRNIHSLKGRYKNIMPPFKKFNSDKSKTFTLTVGDDKEVHSLIKPKTNIINNELGKVFQHTTNEQALKKNKNYISKLKKKAAKEFGVSEDEIQLKIEKHLSNETFTVRVLTENNLLFLELAKVAYEAAADIVLGYAKTDSAKAISKMLLEGKYNYDAMPHPDINLEIPVWMAENYHFVSLEYIPSLGLVAIVQVFEADYENLLIQAFILSKSEVFAFFKPVLILNDFLNRKCEISNPNIY